MSGAPQDWYAGASDVGLVRPGNEDAWLAQPPLFVVADGLGGHQAGEIASRIAVDTLARKAPKGRDPHALDEAVQAANLAIIDAAREGRGRSGMGTTLTAVVADGTHLVVSHVGDSRAYLFHDGRLGRVTEDHSMVADMVRQGTLTEEESRFHPNRSVITRALGTDPTMLPDTFEAEGARGDRLLISSDGLHGQVADREIEEILKRAPTPADAASALVAAANDAGGVDNVTVVVVDLDGSSWARAGTTGRSEAAGAPRARTAPSAARGDAARTWLARTAWAIAVVAVLGLAWWAVRSWAFSRAYLKERNGIVVVYQGVPGTFAGITLSELATTSPVPVVGLRPDVARRLVEPGGIPQDSLEAALRQLELYRREAQPATTPLSPGPPGPAPRTGPFTPPPTTTP